MPGRSLLPLLLLVALAGAAYLILSPRQDAPPGPGQLAGSAAQDPGAADPLAPAPADGAGRTAVETGTDGAARAFVRGRVLGPDGAALAGATVRLITSGGFLDLGLVREQFSADAVPVRADGSFSLALDTAGPPARVGAVAPGYAPRRSEPIAAGAEIELRLVSSVRVSGVVVDGAGAPVADATLLLGHPDPTFDGLPGEQRSGDDGRFALEAPGAGSYRLAVRSAAGEDLRLDPFAVRAGMEPLRLVVQGAGGLVVMAHQPDGAPVAGARVEVASMDRRADPLGARRARTGADGVARLFSLPIGSYVLSVRAPGFVPVELRHVQRDVGPLTVEVELAAPGGVEARVLDRDGALVPGFEVRLHRRENDPARPAPPRQVHADPQGVARFEDLLAGSYLVIGGGQGWELETEVAHGDGDAGMQEKAQRLGSSTAPVEVLPGAIAQVDLVLGAHARVRAEVTEAGHPVAGAEVLLLTDARQPNELAQVRGVTGGDGAVLLPPVRPGRYVPKALLENGLSEILGEPFSVAEAFETVRIEVPGGAVSGRLLAGSTPLAGVVVRAEEPRRRPGAGGAGSAAVTAADGSFRIARLPAGPMLLVAHAPECLPWSSEPFDTEGTRSLDLGAQVLELEARLSGQVLGLPPEAELAFSFRVVELFDAQGNAAGTTPLEVGDRFSFVGLRPGAYRMVVTAAGQRRGEAEIQLVAGANQQVWDLR